MTRIYVVKTPTDSRLVQAVNASQAIRHAVRNQYSANVATQEELVAMLGAGATVERAKEPVETIAQAA